VELVDSTGKVYGNPFSSTGSGAGLWDASAGTFAASASGQGRIGVYSGNIWTISENAGTPVSLLAGPSFRNDTTTGTQLFTLSKYAGVVSGNATVKVLATGDSGITGLVAGVCVANCNNVATPFAIHRQEGFTLLNADATGTVAQNWFKSSSTTGGYALDTGTACTATRPAGALGCALTTTVSGLAAVNLIPDYVVSAGGVTSVFTRTGAVVAAGGDYTLDQIGNPAANATFTFPATFGETLAGTAPAVQAGAGTAATSPLNINGVTGGATSGTGTTAGAGNSPTNTAGNGGTSSGGTNVVGGAGGSQTITAGNGGASTGTAANSNGGGITLMNGAAGTGGSGAAGVTGTTVVDTAGACGTADIFNIKGNGVLKYEFLCGGTVNWPNSPANLNDTQTGGTFGISTAASSGATAPGSITISGGNYTGTTASKSGAAITEQSGGVTSASAVATDTGGQFNILGGDVTANSAGLASNLLLTGGRTSSTNSASAAGTTVLSSGSASGGGQMGLLALVGNRLKGAGTTTLWNLQCGTSIAWTVNDCATSADNQLIAGVAMTTTTPVAVLRVGSEVPVNSDNSCVVGNVAIVSTTVAGKIHDTGGTTFPTAGTGVGHTIAISGTYTLINPNTQATISVTASATLPIISFTPE
jgi:hypothetical protein